MRRSIQFILLLVLFRIVVAEPHFAIRSGHLCSQCHVNRTGGGMRTAFGFLYSETFLSGKNKSVKSATYTKPISSHSLSQDSGSVSTSSETKSFQGRELYLQSCSMCHGPNGGGDGPVGGGLNPKPTNFRLDNYKHTGTTRDNPPSEADLKKVIQNGVPATAMVPWGGVYSEKQIEEIINFIKTFNPRLWQVGSKETTSVIIPQPEIKPSPVIQDHRYSLTNQLPLRIGANFRLENFTHFRYNKKITEPIPADTNSSTLKDTTYTVQAVSSNFLYIPEGNVYIELKLVDEFVKLYVDQTVAPFPQSREAFIIFQWQTMNTYLKAGKMLAPYGIRLYDDQTFTRDIPRFTYANPEIALEVGFEPHLFTNTQHLSTTLNIAADQFSLNGSLLFVKIPFITSLQLGGSIFRTYPSTKTIFSKTPWEFVNPEVDDHAWGAYGGINYKNITFLGEVDFFKAKENNQAVSKKFGFIELDIAFAKLMNGRFEYDWLNPNTLNPFNRNGRSRFVLGVEAFLLQYVQVGIFYHLRQSVPEDREGNQDQMRVQLHGFY